MKKKLLSVIMASMVALTLVACGNSSKATTTTETPAAAKQEAVVPETPAVEKQEAASTTETLETVAEEMGDFTILDVTTDLVDVGIYAVDDSNTEYVITLFRDPDQNPYISLMLVNEDGSGDIICGSYDDSSITIVPDEENGVDWTVFEITDVYTEVECTIVFAEGDDGSVAITNSDFSVIMEGEYLSNEDTI
ncbi:MAG: hypothetical protein ACI4D2_02070, partial [Lachnospiraceae bacterium]